MQIETTSSQSEPLLSWQMPDRDKILKAFVEQDKSYTQIGIMFGVTRGIVAGRVWRLNGYKKKPVNLSPTEGAFVERIERQMRVEVPAEIPEPLEPGIVSLFSARVPGAAATTPQYLPLVDLADNGCRYPLVEHEGRHLFCGAVAYTPSYCEYHSPYCQEHFKLCYREKREREDD